MESVLCVECDGIWETGECVAVELTLITGEYLHIIVEYLTPRTAGSRGRFHTQTQER